MKQTNTIRGNELRYHRQLDLVPMDKLAEHSVTVVGLGAGGRQVAMLLASMGVTNATLVDFDTVEITNISTQGYLEEDVGKAKVEAAKSQWLRVNARANILCQQDYVGKETRMGDTIFCCVDSMASRKMLWEMAGKEAWYWADGRMGEEVVRVLTAYSPLSRRYYESTLVSDEECREVRCTARGTLYMAYLSSSLLVGGFARRLRDIPVAPDVCFSMTTDCCIVKDGKQAAAPK